MSFLTPWVLIWALPVIGIIVGLYLLKMRRRDLEVPASFLWPSQVEEIRANSLFQRLRFSWLLVLQLLAAVVACLILARPQVLSRGLTGRSTVIVIDSSLTMGATDVKPTRLEGAKTRAREIVNAAAPGEKVAIIDADIQPEVVSPLAESRADQIRAINGIRQSDAPPTVGEALRIAAALVSNNPSARIVLLSDDAFGSIANFSPGKANLAFECIGNSDDNLSVSAFGFTDSAKGRGVYCALRNTGNVPQQGILNVFADGASVRSEKVTLMPQKEWSSTFEVPRSASLLEAKLDAKDSLPADNDITVVSGKGSALRVLLVTQEDPFTEKALALEPRVSLDRSNDVPQSELSPQTCRYDVIVFDGVPERPVATPSVLVLGSSSGSAAVKNPSFQSQESDPILNSVDLSQVGISQNERLDAGSARVLASNSAGPELLAFSGPQRKIVLSFAPLKSDFPLQPAYPIFISNCLAFLGGNDSKSPVLVHPGQAFVLTSRSSAQVIDSDGKQTVVTARNGEAAFGGLARTGVYKLQVDGQKRDLYCTLEPHEISIKPVAKLMAGAADVKSSAAALSAVDIWRYAAALLLALLLFEWLFYARKS